LSLEQLERLVKIVLKPSKDDAGRASDFDARINAVDAIASYGEAAIPALIQVSEETTESYVKEHALELITRIKQR